MVGCSYHCPDCEDCGREDAGLPPRGVSKGFLPLSKTPRRPADLGVDLDAKGAKWAALARAGGRTTCRLWGLRG